MDPERARELLPFYLNRTLDEGEEAEVRRYLEQGAEAPAELEATRAALRVFGQHLSSETLLDAAEGRVLEGPSREVLEGHLDACPSCREELDLLLRSREALEGAPEGASDRLAEGPGAPSRGWRWLAVAASLAAALGTAGWVWTGATSDRRVDTLLAERAALEDRLEHLEGEVGRLRAEREPAAHADGGQGLGEQQETRDALRRERAELELKVAELGRPAPNVAVVDLDLVGDAVLRGGAGGSQEVVSKAAGRAIFILHSAGLPEGAVAQARVLDARERAVWIVEGLRGDPLDGSFTLDVPLAGLEAGTEYRIEILGPAGEPLETYEPFLVTP